MEVITPTGATRRPPFTPLLGGTILGTVLVVTGIVLAYLAFATPILGSVLPTGRPSIGQLAAGIAVWAIALVGPAALLLAGASRLARSLATVRARSPKPSATHQALESLSSELVVASGIVLPDGRSVADLVIGPFGAAVIRQLPPAGVTRIRGGRWEARSRRGWISLEDPLERATRDAERVRRWLGHDDADFLVKVYAAVVGPARGLSRTPTCAVVEPDQLAGWIEALPPQRSLTEGRREQMIELIRDAADR